MSRPRCPQRGFGHANLKLSQHGRSASRRVCKLKAKRHGVRAIIVNDPLAQASRENQDSERILVYRSRDHGGTRPAQLGIQLSQLADNLRAICMCLCGLGKIIFEPIFDHFVRPGPSWSTPVPYCYPISPPWVRHICVPGVVSPVWDGGLF